MAGRFRSRTGTPKKRGPKANAVSSWSLRALILQVLGFFLCVQKADKTACSTKQNCVQISVSWAAGFVHQMHAGRILDPIQGWILCVQFISSYAKQSRLERSCRKPDQRAISGFSVSPGRRTAGGSFSLSDHRTIVEPRRLVQTFVVILIINSAYDWMEERAGAPRDWQ